MGFPTVRLYRRTVTKRRSFSEFPQARNAAALSEWIKKELKKQEVSNPNLQFHNFFSEGCRAEGFVEVARVPGTLHLEASHSDDTCELQICLGLEEPNL